MQNRRTLAVAMLAAVTVASAGFAQNAGAANDPYAVAVSRSIIQWHRNGTPPPAIVGGWSADCRSLNGRNGGVWRCTVLDLDHNGDTLARSTYNPVRAGIVRRGRGVVAVIKSARYRGTLGTAIYAPEAAS